MGPGICIFWQSQACSAFCIIPPTLVRGACPCCVCRLHERQATHISVTVRDSSAATATSVSASNLLLGHGLLLRLAALAEASDEAAALEQQEGEREQAVGQELGPSQQAAPQPSPAASPQRQALEQLRQRLEDSAASSEVAAASGAAAVAPAPAGDQEQAACQAVEEPAASAEQEAEAANGTLSAESSEGSTGSSVSVQRQPQQKQQQQKQEEPLGSHQSLAADTEQLHAAAAAAAALPPPPAKQTLTSIQLADCRLVLRYQPGLHPGGSGGGSGIPAATHDFLSIHQDLVALDVPLLRLQLPLDPASLSAAAEAAAAAAERSAGGSEQAVSPAGGSSGVTPAGGSPATVTSSGSSTWQDSPSVAPSSSTGAAPRPLGQQQEQQVLAEASRLTLSVASVGYARHAMLPLLQLPSLRLACSTSAPPSARAAAGAVVAYRLDVAALDIGLHPSQLSMLTSAVQLCQHELALLGREPPDSSADTESMVTSASGAGEQQQPLLRRPVSAPLRPAAAALAGGSPSAQAAAAAAAAEATPRGPYPQPGGPGAATPGSSSPEQEVAPSQRLPQWRLEAAVDSIGVSLLGLAPSSSCLKLEWQELRAAYAAGGSVALQPGKLGSSAAGLEAGQQQQELQLSWQQLSLHVLTPHLSYTHPGITPFAFAAAFAAGGTHRRGSQHSNLGAGGGGSPRAAPGSPRSISLAPPGGAPPAASASEVLWQRGRGPLSASGAAAAGVRRNLSVGLGLAGGPAILHVTCCGLLCSYSMRHCSHFFTHRVPACLCHPSMHIQPHQHNAALPSPAMKRRRQRGVFRRGRRAVAPLPRLLPLLQPGGI